MSLGEELSTNQKQIIPAVLPRELPFHYETEPNIVATRDGYILIAAQQCDTNDKRREQRSLERREQTVERQTDASPHS